MKRPFAVPRVLPLALLLVLQGACGGGAPESAEAPAVSARVGQAVVRDFDVTVTALGTVSALPGSMARVSAPGESFVSVVDVGPGDPVRKGDPLVELDRSVWSERAAEADAALSAAQEAVNRTRGLVDQGILPRKELEAATAELARSRATAADAHRTLERAVLRAPMTGVVTAVRAAVDQPVAMNDVLVELVDGAGLEVRARVGPDDAGRVPRGARVVVRAGADPSAADVAWGSVRGVSSSVDSLSGTVTVRAVLDSIAGGLRPGQTVSARISVDRIPSAVVVPAAALVPVTDGMVVFVVDSAGVAHQTSVEAGFRTSDSVTVRSGLAGGERVVLSGSFGVVDGARIEESESP
jgi:RND family efflux transporter MFP subunit